ncbi:hypothetical protein G4B88_003788 [Cannabis sativa]|uniref:60S ribosomal protein L23 n=1 Tax=Cannabis sativa TaxID=3483 RepID=A0A7J6FL04_CANSA|nr:hypothetical protein G4B88_003788 [Cannabis sativa]
MANKFVKSKKTGFGNEDSLDSLSEEKELCGEVKYRSKSERIIRWVNPEQALILSVKHSKIGKSGGKHPFFKSTHGLDYMIPKPMISLDEKYLRRCLELIHFRASRAARWNASVNMSSVENLSPETRSGNAFDSAGLVFACPMIAGTENLVISPTGQLVLGTIMGSKSMLNILKSPLLQQYGALDSNANSKNVNSNDVNDSICYDYMESPSVLSMSSPLNVNKGTPTRERNKYGSDITQKRLVYSSSTNSACSDQTSSSATATINQGMLQCTWKGGNPHFVLSMDDHKDVYVANLWKVESKGGDKGVDYIYLFHSGKGGGQKDHEISDSHSHLVAKMKVSSSFTLAPSNSKIMETEFVLYGGNEHYMTELQTCSHNLRKSKAFTKKMSEVFKNSISSKHKTVPKYSGSSAILEDCSLESSLDTSDNHESAVGSGRLEDLPPTNFELAAVVVKDHIVNSQKEEPGGWGLGFLKKVGIKQTTKSLEASEGFRNSGDCSTSMDILIPAGVHGGPRTRNSGPSSLTERWRSGGVCDCGGWDIGCPLKILKPISSNNDVLPNTQGECKSFDFTIQGSEPSTPTLRIVNVQDDLHFIQFQRTLSVLQSFSIAVAIIHSRSHTLRPKDVHELNWSDWVLCLDSCPQNRLQQQPTMSKRGRGGSAGNKFRMSLGLPVAATVNCADNTGAKNLYIISVKGIKGRLNRLPSACVGDMVMATVKKGKPDLRKKVLPAVIVRQRKPWRRKDGVFMYFEDNAGVIVNPKGEMKGSAITGPIGKECADLWPRIASAANAIV